MICLQAGEWQENLIVEKSLTLRAAEVKPKLNAVIKSAKEGWPVIMIRSDKPIEVTVTSLKITGAFGWCYQREPEGIYANGISVHSRAQAVIQGTTISGNKWGIGIWDSSQATIENNSISGNRDDGIFMRDSAQANIGNNKIVNNGRYGVVCFQRPCLDVPWKFEGAVRGSGNEISGNKKADVCPEDLKFLMTPAGGCYGPKC